MAPRATARDEIVVVTGAAGFLGTKVVELLNTKGQNIMEIRGFDICPQKPSCFLQSYDPCGKVMLRYSQEDVRNYEEVGYKTSLSLCVCKLYWMHTVLLFCWSYSRWLRPTPLAAEIRLGGGGRGAFNSHNPLRKRLVDCTLKEKKRMKSSVTFPRLKNSPIFLIPLRNIANIKGADTATTLQECSPKGDG